MEEDIRKEQNQTKRNTLIREQKVIEYLKNDNNFQNLFNLPSGDVTIESVLAKYHLADEKNMGTEISLEILTGIHKNFVIDISNDLNGIVLNPDGTINEDASKIQAKEIEKEEQRKNFYIEKSDDSIDKILETFGLTKEKENEAKNIYEEFRKDNHVCFEKPHTPFQEKEAVDRMKEELGIETAEGERVLKDAIKLNEIIIDEVNNNNFTEKEFKKLSPNDQYAWMRALCIELGASDEPFEVLKAIRTIMPELKNIEAKDIFSVLYSNLEKDDNVLRILNKVQVKELNSYDMIDLEEMQDRIANISNNKNVYKNNGTLNVKRFKEAHKDDLIDAAFIEYKKTGIERLVFGKIDKFDEYKETRFLSLYKNEIIKEAEKIDPSRKEDPNLWKEIQPAQGSTLKILEDIVKESNMLFSDYMDGSLRIDFDKLYNLKNEDKRFAARMEKGLSIIDKTKEEYLAKKENILQHMKNIDKMQNKEVEIEFIRKELHTIPKEIVLLDLQNEKTYRDYMKKNDPDYSTFFKRQYERQTAKPRKNRVIIMENQRKIEREKLKKMEVKDGDVKDDISKEERSVIINGRKIRFSGVTFSKDAPKLIGAVFKDKNGNIIKKMRGMRLESGNVRFELNDEAKERLSKRQVKRAPKIDNGVIAVANKDISGATSLSKYMAKPKMIVDEIEIPVTGETNSEKASHTFETLLKEQGLAAKFKSVEGDLTVDEYASKMGEILTNINEKIKDGTLPSEININGDVKQTTLKDIVSMNFENTEILLENLPEDISKMSKEDIEKAIKTHIEEKAKEDKGQEEKKKNEQVQEKSEIEEPVVEANAARDDSKEDSELTQEELQKRLAKEQLEKMVEQEKAKEEVKQEIEQEVKKETRQEENEVKKEDNRMEETALAKPTFFSEMKRKFLESKIGKKITEIFGKKEDKDVVSAAIANVSENSNPVTKDEGDFVQRVDGDKILRDAQKEMEEKRMQVGVGNGQKQTEIGEK